MILDIHNEDECRILREGLAGKTVGLASGCFDLLHYLHLIFLQRCRRKCNVLFVGVDSDDLVRQVKGPERPVVPENQRAAMVDALKPVFGVFVMGSVEDFGKAIERLGVNVLFKNDAFKGRESEVVGCDLARLEIIPDISQPDSTSGIVKEIIRRRTQVQGEPVASRDGG